MSVRAHREDAGVLTHHLNTPLHKVIVTGCFVRRIADGEVFQVDIAGTKAAVGLKPDQGGDRIWVLFTMFDRGYELVGR